MAHGPLSSVSGMHEPDTVHQLPPSQEDLVHPGGWALVRYAGQPIGEVVWVGEDGLSFGRSADNRMQFLEPEVSRRHALVERLGRDGRLHVVDLSSTNGTFLNGVRVPPRIPLRLSDGDVLCLGCHAFKVRCLDALELAFHEAVLAQTTVDALTGLSNRVTVLGFLEKQAELARRHRRPLSVMLADLDHFKAINDVHGHAAGDRVLQAFGGIVKGRIRLSDHAGRIGGEEFVVVLPETSLNEATSLAEELREALVEERISIGGNSEPLAVTCSIGVAQLGYDDQVGGAVLARADRCLYRAKALGRNCVICELA